MSSIVPALSYGDSPSLEGERLVAIEDLSLVYGRGKKAKEVLSGVQLELGEREFVCVLGASGSGKTSLLRLIAGYEQPTSGFVRVLGKEKAAPNSEVGVVFQHANLFPWLSIQRNVEFGLRMQGVGRADRTMKAAEAIRQVGLRDAADRLPYQLSGGMKQRAAIARTLAASPRLILMDEPFGALDAITRENLQQQLRQLWLASQQAVFFITHDVDEALLLATRIVVLSGSPGKVAVDMPNPLYSEEETAADLRKHRDYGKLREQLVASLKQEAY
ncbi:ABC transporter ATP-binding protein [Cohnella sp. AR92]|uniref:ABC transporter ATP-binding protein n=1 Tax=Cohnella sp. AR92 TaxID=648716 RepID=UPI000F8E98B8|nr:ABC transporter ATP-binding protein [Cohnella sp. AR92]RUS48401.1 ABC transporter ATP-binding protein [Cohnella sp. AR92]